MLIGKIVFENKPLQQRKKGTKLLFLSEICLLGNFSFHSNFKKV